MKIRRLMTWVLGLILLSLPMMCMHAGDGHHDGGHHFSIYQPAVESRSMIMNRAEALTRGNHNSSGARRRKVN